VTASGTDFDDTDKMHLAAIDGRRWIFLMKLPAMHGINSCHYSFPCNQSHNRPITNHNLQHCIKNRPVNNEFHVICKKSATRKHAATPWM